MLADTLARRLGAELPAKALMLVSMAIAIVIPYFGLQRWRPFPAREPFVTRLDALVPFDPGFALAYLSVCVLVPLFPMLALRRDDVLRFGRGIAWLCLPCFAFFLLAPMPGPRPAAVSASGVYGWLVGVDATWNAFPSLHAGLVVYSFLYGWRVLGSELGARGRRAFALCSLAWAATILYGTLATKQHWLADLPPAFVLAFVADRLAWRGAPQARLRAKRSAPARTRGSSETAGSDAERGAGPS